MWMSVRIACLCLALQACAAHVTQAQGTGFDRFWQSAEPGYLELYRGLHRQPELALHEEKTSARAAEQLRRFGYEVTTGVGGFGVVAVLKNGPGRTVLVRGDMDGLPVAEETGLAFASTQRTVESSGREVPVMHACGHDLHLTNLLATAEWLAAQRASWRGTLLIVAQPAEEIGEGARSMIADGLFKRFPKPDYALALHVEPELASGHVGIVSGWAAANTDSVDVDLYGRGGHGSRPQDAVDPIVMAAQYVMALQTLVSRRNDPLQPAVITVGSIHGGSKHSIIPDSVHLQLTVRSYSDATRTALLDGIRQLANDLSTTFRAPKPPTIAMKESYTPAVWNDPKLASQAREWLGNALGKDAVGDFQPQMSGEDFGRYGRELKIPSLLVRLGATPTKQLEASRLPGAAPVPGLHSSKFAPDASLTLRTGVRVLSTMVTALLPPAANSGAPRAAEPKK
jgi:amidohydrolase